MPEEKPTLRGTLTLEPRTLWKRVTDRTEYAIESGALQSIPTEYEFVEQDGIRFLVRILTNLARKDEAKKKQDKKSEKTGKEFNPFLPYDEDLFVADLSDTHVCLLNKFNVVDYHLLMVTREFEEQENLLNLQDFEAMWGCLTEFNSLAFYNGGKMAGASQRHKHLQLIPLPIASEGPQIPIDPAIASAIFEESVGTSPDFPFVHAIARFDLDCADSPRKAAETILEYYYTLLRAVGLDPEANGNKQSGPYNLLATREWMLIVPRSQETFESISVNSLGFAGGLLVRNPEEMQKLKDTGPMNVLKNVARSTGESSSMIV